MSIRQQYELLEEQTLSPLASLAKQSKGRELAEDPCPIRTMYQRDKDRILHSQAFRRLMHKTQVFLSPTGDHYRTRLTHTLEVTQIARTVARALRLNEDLTEAIALGHDLGHTPFGHTGEDVLNALLDGGFRHNEQSVRVVEVLEKDGRGLNLTKEVRDGILCHSGSRRPFTLEGEVVRHADRIAYISHDIDDALRGGILLEQDIPQTTQKTLGSTKSERIATLVASLIEHSGATIAMAPEQQEEFNKLREFMFEAVYHNVVVKAEQDKAKVVVEQLYSYFLNHPDKMSASYRALVPAHGKDRVVCDYVSSMTDRYAVALYEELFIPKSWGIS